MSMLAKKPFTTHIGYTCPKCELDATLVIDSRQNESGHVWRRRKCKTCGFRFRTIEHMEGALVPDSELAQYKAFKKLLPKFFALADYIDELSAEHD